MKHPSWHGEAACYLLILAYVAKNKYRSSILSCPAGYELSSSINTLSKTSVASKWKLSFPVSASCNHTLGWKGLINASIPGNTYPVFCWSNTVPVTIGFSLGSGKKEELLLGRRRSTYVILLGVTPFLPLPIRTVLINSVPDAPTSDTVRQFVQCVWRLPFFLRHINGDLPFMLNNLQPFLCGLLGLVFFKHCCSECNK